MRLILLSLLAVASAAEFEHRIASRSEILTAITPPSEDVMAMGTSFVYSYLNAHLSASDTSYTEKLYLTITNPSAQPANVAVTSKYPTFQNRSIVVQPNMSILLPITPVDIQTDYMDNVTTIIFKDNKAIWVNSDVPIKLTATNQLNDGSSEDKFTILPICQLGNNYVAVNDEGPRNDGYTATNIITVIATQDGTTVQICGLPPLIPYNLNKGDQATLVMGGGLSSCVIKANKPVAAITGSVCGFGYYKPNHCSHEALMLVPVTSWGVSYPYFKFQPEDSGELMMFISTPNTSVSYDGRLQGNTYNSSIFYIIRVPNGVTITADKPIYVSAIGSSNSLDQGAPFFAHVVPAEWFTNGPVVFATAMTSDESAHMTHFVRIAVLVGDVGKVAVDGYYPNGLIYRRMGGGDYYFVDWQVATGQHVITAKDATTKFGLTVYGYGTFRSYAFNPGMDLPSIGTC